MEATDDFLKAATDDDDVDVVVADRAAAPFADLSEGKGGGPVDMVMKGAAAAAAAAPAVVAAAAAAAAEDEWLLLLLLLLNLFPVLWRRRFVKTKESACKLI